MGFDTLLGNDRLKENLSSSLARGRAAHFYLISGPEGAGKHTLARLLSAGLLCEGSDKPCLRCQSCRKVMASLHPDVITVEDPEHKNVSVKLVREARSDMYVVPNEGSRKIYIFPQELGLEGQNALLKVLEEPPSYGVFLLLSDNPEKLLPTVRSRCTELKLNALPAGLLRRELGREFPKAGEEAVEAAISRSGGYYGQAKKLLSEGSELPPQTEGFARSFAGRDVSGLLQTLVPMEKWKRDQLIPVLQQWLGLLEAALVCRAGLPAASEFARDLAAGRSSQELMDAVGALKKAIEYAQGNVSPGAVCGWLEWALR